MRQSPPLDLQRQEDTHNDGYIGLRKLHKWGLKHLNIIARIFFTRVAYKSQMELRMRAMHILFRADQEAFASEAVKLPYILPSGSIEFVSPEEAATLHPTAMPLTPTPCRNGTSCKGTKCHFLHENRNTNESPLRPASADNHVNEQSLFEIEQWARENEVFLYRLLKISTRLSLSIMERLRVKKTTTESKGEREWISLSFLNKCNSL